ncbi:hypothetical protein [Streptomyces sp. NPDC003273]|uniref:hypothetical protein n=1 Tax=Streptomyces sp. NPDC003273 TaxID=3364678 RepID=UPI0036AAD05A
MTKIEPGANERDATEPHDAHETSTIREQLLERTCAWCGDPVAYSGRGRPPRYCSPVHRRRAWEVRTAQARAERPASEGGKSREPVREVIERTETVVRTVVRPATAPSPAQLRPARRLSGQPYTLPEDAVEWIEALAALRREVTNPKVHPFREHIARACEKTLQALRADDPETADNDD